MYSYPVRSSPANVTVASSPSASTVSLKGAAPAVTFLPMISVPIVVAREQYMLPSSSLPTQGEAFSSATISYERDWERAR